MERNGVLTYPGKTLTPMEFKTNLNEIEMEIKEFHYTGSDYAAFEGSETSKKLKKRNLELASIPTLWTILFRNNICRQNIKIFKITLHKFSRQEISQLFAILKRFTSLTVFNIYHRRNIQNIRSQFLYYHLNDFLRERSSIGKPLNIVWIYIRGHIKFDTEKEQDLNSYFLAKNCLYVEQRVQYSLSDNAFDRCSKYYILFLEECLRNNTKSKKFKLLIGKATLRLKEIEKYIFAKEAIKNFVIGSR